MLNIKKTFELFGVIKDIKDNPKFNNTWIELVIQSDDLKYPMNINVNDENQKQIILKNKTRLIGGLAGIVGIVGKPTAYINKSNEARVIEKFYASKISINGKTIPVSQQEQKTKSNYTKPASHIEEAGSEDNEDNFGLGNNSIF